MANRNAPRREVSAALEIAGHKVHVRVVSYGAIRSAVVMGSLAKPREIDKWTFVEASNKILYEHRAISVAEPMSTEDEVVRRIDDVVRCI